MRASGALLTVLAVLLVPACSDRSAQSKAVKGLVETLSRGEANDRAKAAAELGRLHASNALPQLVRATMDLRPEVRLAAVEALVEIGDPRAADVLCTQLKSPAWRNRQLAAQGLGRLRSQFVVPQLRESVRDEHVAVAAAAAEALVACGGLADLKAIAVSTNEPMDAREAALLILGESGPDALSAILEAMNDKDPAVRTTAYGVVGKAAGAKDVPVLVAGLLDQAQGVRKAAQKALLSMPPDVVLPTLIATLATGTLEQQNAVLKMVDADRTARGVGVLAAALVCERASVRGSAERILAERRQHMNRAKQDPRVLPVEMLLGGLSSSNAEVRAAAILHIEQDSVVNRSAEPRLTAALKDPSPAVRLAALRFLAGLAPERMEENLAPLLQDADTGVRRAAAKQLAPRTNELAVAIVVETIEQELREYQQASEKGKKEIVDNIGGFVDSIRRSGSPKATQCLVRLLDVNDDELTTASIRALGAIGDRSVYDKVTPFLGRTKWGEQNVRCAAIEAMAALDPARAADTLVPLLAAVDTWQGESTLSTMCRVLGRMKEARAAGPMIDRMRERYANASGKMDEVKLAAAAGLVDMGEQAVPTIVRRLNETKVRDGVLAMILGKIGAPAVQPVIEALKSDDAMVRKNAAWALGYMKVSPEMADPLISLLADKESTVRTAAAWSLGQLQVKKAMQALVPMLASEQAGDRLAAAEALGRVNNLEAVQSLIAKLNDPVTDVRFAVVTALGALGDKAAIDPLHKVASDDKEERVRFAAGEALAGLGVSRPEH